MRHIPPRLFEWTVKAGDTPKDVIARLEEKPEYWFITVVDDNGRLNTVVEEEAFWPFVKTQILSEDHKDSTAAVAYDGVMGKTVQDVLADEKGGVHAGRLQVQLCRYTGRLVKGLRIVCRQLEVWRWPLHG